MGPDLERQPIGRGKPVAAGDRRATSSNILVDRGLALTNARAANLEGQFTIAVDPQPVGTLQAELDATGIGPRMDDEVVFQLALVAVVLQVNPGVHIAVRDPREGRHANLPVARILANQVIGLSGELLLSGRLR